MLGEHRRLSEWLCKRIEARERIVQAALEWLDHADAAVEQDDELVELAKATRALLEIEEAPPR